MAITRTERLKPWDKRRRSRPALHMYYSIVDDAAPVSRSHECTWVMRQESQAHSPKMPLSATYQPSALMRSGRPKPRIATDATLDDVIILAVGRSQGRSRRDNRYGAAPGRAVLKKISNFNQCRTTSGWEPSRDCENKMRCARRHVGRHLCALIK